MQQASSAQAIPLPPAQQLDQQQRRAADVAMSSPATTGASFDPASYTRTLFGSPVSWRESSSFGAPLYPNTSPSQLFGSSDPTSSRLPSSAESDRCAFTETQNEFCRNYTCCGLNLSDLHALVEHFEEAHVVVIDPSAPHQPSLLPNQLSPTAAHYPQRAQQQYLRYPGPGPVLQAQSFDPLDDMELDDQSPPSSSASSSPRTPPYVPTLATQVSHVPEQHSAFSTQPPSAFPGPVSQQSKQELDISKSIAQAAPATPTQRTPSLTGPAPLSPGGVSKALGPNSTLSCQSLALLLTKPFRCPKQNCNRSYKQANGLKYHVTHGSCSSALPKDLEAVQAVLAEKGLSAEADLPESDACEIKREAEQRLRPFACAVGKCTRRYKSMNGLRYHYQHSGEHGAEGLRLLASGHHKCLQHLTGRAHQAQAAAAMALVVATKRGAGTLHPVSSLPAPVAQRWSAQQ